MIATLVGYLQKKLLYPRFPKGEGGILFYLCPSKIFVVAFFSVTVDGRNLIFGHKLHIGTPYHGKCFLTRQFPTSCLPKSGGIILFEFKAIIFVSLVSYGHKNSG